MNMPGFTAETSLYNGNVRYQATTEAIVYGGLVQPAGPFGSFSDVIFRDRRIYCLKWKCGQLPGRDKPFCSQVLGIWNPVTHSCE